MELLRVQWSSLGLLFLMIEMMVMSLDFLALGVAALVTSLLLALRPDTFSSSILLPSFIFLVISIVNVIITRMLILPQLRIKHKPPALSIDALIGQHLIIQHENNMDVVFREGKYWPIQEEHHKLLHIGNTIIVRAISGNTLIVSNLHS